MWHLGSIGSSPKAPILRVWLAWSAEQLLKRGWQNAGGMRKELTRRAHGHLMGKAAFDTNIPEPLLLGALGARTNTRTHTYTHTHTRLSIYGIFRMKKNTKGLGKWSWENVRWQLPWASTSQNAIVGLLRTQPQWWTKWQRTKKEGNKHHRCSLDDAEEAPIYPRNKTSGSLLSPQKQKDNASPTLRT